MNFLYVTTISNTTNAFLIPHIRMLVDMGHNVDIAFNIDRETSSELFDMGCTLHVIPFNRNPLSIQNIKAYKLLRKLLDNNNYDLIHTHTPVASACVRLACRKFKRLRIIYTAHGFHFHDGASYVNWLLYYPIEKFLSKYTDTIITINTEDFKRAKKSFYSSNIAYIPGVGIDLNRFKNLAVEKENKKAELKIPANAIILVSVGELNRNKNHKTVIRAISHINDPNIYYLICGKGKLEKYLLKLIKSRKLQNNVRLLGHRNDIIEILKSSDIFILPSYREGLSLSLMEAMANGLPVICTDIRGNVDLIEEGKGGYLVQPDDVDGFAQAIKKLCESSSIKEFFSEFNLKKIQHFSIEKVLTKLKYIYFNHNVKCITH